MAPADFDYSAGAHTDFLRVTIFFYAHSGFIRLPTWPRMRAIDEVWTQFTASSVFFCITTSCGRAVGGVP
jgi:hypothetical protein